MISIVYIIVHAAILDIASCFFASYTCTRHIISLRPLRKPPHQRQSHQRFFLKRQRRQLETSVPGTAANADPGQEQAVERAARSAEHVLRGEEEQARGRAGMPPKTAEQRGPGTPIGMMVGTAQAEGAAGPHTALAPPTLIEGQLPGTVDCHNCGFTSMPRAPRPSKCMACNIEICGTCLMNNGVLGRTPVACTRCGELARMA